MARKKLEIKATRDQIETLKESLAAGTPLALSLKRANISAATYYYWVAVSCVVSTARSQEEIEEMEELANSGVSVQEVRDLAGALTKGRKTDIGTYIEPSAESLLQYKNNRKFKAFADQCFDIVSSCDKLRADYAQKQLEIIKLSTMKKNGLNPSGAMWWLERNYPDFYAKPSDRAKEEENEIATVPAIKVEFVNPDTTDTKQRLIDMESEILKDLKRGGDA